MSGQLLDGQTFCLADKALNPLCPRSNLNSHCYQLYNPNNCSSKNLVFDQLIMSKLIFFFILNTNLVDIVLIL